jgi:uncharacterized protein YndB with AHSA1/START domain
MSLSHVKLNNYPLQRLEREMIQHQIDLQIKRPVEEVFAFLTNANNHPKWDSLSVSMEPQEVGAWHKGMKFKEVRKIGRRNTEVASQIEVFDPNRRMEIQSLTGPSFHGTWIFEPVNTGTRLLYTAQMQLNGIMRLLEPLIAGQFRQQLEANFTNLKRVLEQGA